MDSRIPCRVRSDGLLCEERKLVWLKETALTGIADLPVRIANTSCRTGASLRIQPPLIRSRYYVRNARRVPYHSHWISNLKPECVEVNQLESFVQKVQVFILLLIIIMFSKQELRSIKRHLKNQLPFMVNLYMHGVQFYSIKCKKRLHEYCV